MMARSHVATGACVLAIGAAAGVWSWHGPAAVRVALLASGLMLAGTLLPDLDHPRSVMSRSWVLAWWLPGTHTVSWLVRFTGQRVYAATRTQTDPDRHSGHRGWTHSLTGTGLLASAVTLACSPAVPHWVTAGTIGLLCGATVRVVDRDYQVPVTVVATVVGLGSPELQAGWPVWWLAIWLGCVVHCLGDSCSESGIPWWWPFAIHGRRWRNVSVLPRLLRFKTGRWGERVALTVIYAGTAGIVWQQLTA